MTVHTDRLPLSVLANQMLPLLAGDNAVFSPVNLAMALGMVRAGAQGQTAEALDAVLGMDLHQLQSLHAQLQSIENAEVHAATHAWCDQRAPLHPEYVRMLHTLVNQDQDQDTPDTSARVRTKSASPIRTDQSVVELLDFKQPAQSCKRINTWVADQTHDKITNLVDASVITPDTLLVLTSALYLKASWEESFNRLEHVPFTTINGSTIHGPAMSRTDYFRYSVTDTAQVVVVPYQDNELEMVIILPEQLHAFEADLDAQMAFVDNALKGSESARLRLQLPVFTFEFKTRLREALTQLGLGMMFGDDADVSEMSDTPLKVSEVIHQAMIDVDEYGTEAAAATAISMLAMAAFAPPPKPIEIKVDRPFLFQIRESSTQAPLFMGRVGNLA